MRASCRRSALERKIQERIERSAVLHAQYIEAIAARARHANLLAAERAARARQMRDEMVGHQPKATPRRHLSKLSCHTDINFLRADKLAGVAKTDSLKPILGSHHKQTKSSQQLRLQHDLHDDEWTWRSSSQRSFSTSKLKVRPLHDHDSLMHNEQKSLDHFRPPPVRVPADSASSPHTYGWIDLF